MPQTWEEPAHETQRVYFFLSILYKYNIFNYLWQWYLWNRRRQTDKDRDVNIYKFQLYMFQRWSHIIFFANSSALLEKSPKLKKTKLALISLSILRSNSQQLNDSLYQSKKINISWDSYKIHLVLHSEITILIYIFLWKFKWKILFYKKVLRFWALQWNPLTSSCGP